MIEILYNTFLNKKEQINQDPMFTIEIAGIPISIANQYSLTEYKCREYLTDRPALFVVSASAEDMKHEVGYVSGYAIVPQTTGVSPSSTRERTNALSAISAALCDHPVTSHRMAGCCPACPLQPDRSRISSQRYRKSACIRH